MNDSPPEEIKPAAALDESALSELRRFFLLLDKWDREAKEEVVDDCHSTLQQIYGETP